MIVQCDSCKAKFQLADERITEKGAKVRCSKCKSVFTVKKQMDQPQDAQESAPPPSQKQPPSAGGAKEEDPFSDFNFSDDLDFGEEEEITVQAPAKPSTPEPEPDFGSDFPDDAPKDPDLSGGQAEKQSEKAPSDEGFDFSDEDFSFSDDNEAPSQDPPQAPASPPAPPPASPPAPPPAPSPAPADDFGDFKLEGDGDAAPPSGQDPSSDEDFGNVSFSDETPDMSSEDGEEEGLGDDVDESGFGDFQFDSDDSLPSDGDDDMGMDADDFVRSSTSRAPVTDDLEASIGDSEMETEKMVEQPDQPPPPPPKPLVQIETGPGSSKWVRNILIVIVLIVGSLIGAVGYTDSKDWFTFPELLSFDFSRVGEIPDKFQIDRGWKEEPDEGDVELVGKPTPQVIVRENGSQIIVVVGSVINNTNKEQSSILVEASLKNEAGEVVDTAQSYCDVEFTAEELKSGSTVFIKDMTTIEHGRNQKCFQIANGESRIFTLVFFNLPGGKVVVSKPRVMGYKALGEEE